MANLSPDEIVFHQASKNGDISELKNVFSKIANSKDEDGKTSSTPSLYCLGPRVAKPKKWFVPNFIFKGWEWCI